MCSCVLYGIVMSDDTPPCSMDHMDVSNTFTQANIDDVDIWVEPAKGYEQYDADGR